MKQEDKVNKRMREILLWLAKREADSLPNPHCEETEEISIQMWDLIYEIYLKGWDY